MPALATREGANLATLTDVELVARAAGNEPRAFEALMRRHNQLLYRTARSILRDDYAAEDCVQEAYLEAFRGLQRFRGESSLATWLVRIVINQALESVRKRRRERASVPLDNLIELNGEQALTAAYADRPEIGTVRAEMRRMLEDRIDRLPDAFRTVFILRAVEDMTVEEIARCLAIPEATVRTRFFRARGMLRESIDRELDLAIEDAFRFLGERCDRIVAAVLDRLRSASPSAPAP